jgi:hypothetical protein
VRTRTGLIATLATLALVAVTVLLAAASPANSNAAEHGFHAEHRFARTVLRRVARLFSAKQGNQVEEKS